MIIDGAIFDMDGTLVDSLMLWDILWAEFGKRYFSDSTYRPSKDADKAVRTMHFKDATKFLHTKFGIGKNPEELYLLSNEIFIDFYTNKVKIKKGVLEFLDYLYKNNVKMCIASASEQKLVELAIKCCGLEKYFSAVISCADIGKGKDTPEVFFLAHKHLGTQLSRTWVFEDSYVALTTAANSGFKTVGVFDKYSYNQDIMKEKSDIYISENEDMSKLIDIFKIDVD